MPSWSTLSVFVPAALVLLVMPGPSVIYIVTRSVDQGRVAGIVSTLGVATGALVHVAAAALGISLLISKSAELFTALKLAGAAYLVVIGLRRLVSDPDVEPEHSGRRHSLRRIFVEGVVVDALNPKVALFFLAFLPQFVDSARGSTVTQMLVLGVLFAVLGCCTDGTYALVSSTIAGRVRPVRATRRVARASGVAYVALGVVAAITRRPVPRPT
jgi:threonine/homoserine/homoserine lactone efflux protein